MKYVVNSDAAAWRIVDGEAVIINLETTHYYSLNESGTFVWNLLAERPHDLDELAGALARHYEQPVDSVRGDLEATQAMGCRKYLPLRSLQTPLQQRRSPAAERERAHLLAGIEDRHCEAHVGSVRPAAIAGRSRLRRRLAAQHRTAAFLDVATAQFEATFAVWTQRIVDRPGGAVVLDPRTRIARDQSDVRSAPFPGQRRRVRRLRMTGCRNQSEEQGRAPAADPPHGATVPQSAAAA